MCIRDSSLYGASFINASGNSMACLDYAGNNSVYSQVINSPTHSAALNTINQNSNLSTPLTVIPPCATVDDGSCILEGCTDSTAINYDPLATIAQTATCVFCADPNAFNYTLNSQTQYPNAPTTACEYCPQVQNISTDNVTYNSFDIIWKNPSPISPPPHIQRWPSPALLISEPFTVISSTTRQVRPVTLPSRFKKKFDKNDY